MQEYIATILSIRNITHDVRSYRLEKPKGYPFIPGQATEVSINKPGWEKEKRPFSFTSLPNESILEFIVKSYTEHHSVTDELYRCRPGDSLILGEAWGIITYKGPGYFIAGGTGITPFISIFRQLHKQQQLAGNKLFFSNRTSRDIILQDELTRMLRKDVTYVLSREKSKTGYISGHIDETFLLERMDDFSKHFYVCGPEPMVERITGILLQSGLSPDNLVLEK